MNTTGEQTDSPNAERAAPDANGQDRDQDRATAHHASDIDQPGPDLDGPAGARGVGVVRLQAAIVAFIASTPQLGFTNDGNPRLYARVGQEHYSPNPDGSYTKLDSTFTDLVMFGASAARAYERLNKGDTVLAVGQLRQVEYTNHDGQHLTSTQFVARRIGHDLARTPYRVQRHQSDPRREPPAPTAEQAKPGREQHPSL